MEVENDAKMNNNH